MTLSGWPAALLLLATLTATVVALPRWLRVAQREHYLPPSVTRFARRWWLLHRSNRLLLAASVLGAAASYLVEPLVLVPAAVAVAGPLGLTLKGRTSKLVWTRRASTVALTVVVLGAVAVALAALADKAAFAVAVVAVALPVLVDVTLAVLRPLEHVVSRRWVARAHKRLDLVNPTRVAITGSYGKTTVKGYLAHLLSGSYATVATPASFNNTAGVSRAINEHLAAGTQVFVAEMGTYSRGEIAAMTAWVRQSVAVLTGIGPVHLERFGSIDNIVRAKCEIFATSATAVINIDAPQAAHEAARLASSGIDVWRCSAVDYTDADVYVGPWGPDKERSGGGPADGHQASIQSPAEQPADPQPLRDVAVVLRGTRLCWLPLGERSATNIACAVAAAAALDVPLQTIADRLGSLPGTANRRQVSLSPSGVTVIDDTYNSNPAGAQAALDLLSAVEADARVVVTPGMVELGSQQREANRTFAAEVAAQVNHLVIVGETNRRALTEGALGDGGCEVHLAATRDDAVRWVRHHARSGDAVLYENDLPDHYP